MRMRKSILKDFHNQAGLSLIELVVASTTVGIVMVGAVSFSSTITPLQAEVSDNSFATMEVTGDFMQLVRDAEQAIGDPTNSGIRKMFTVFGNPKYQYICFRHDFDNDPMDYTGDQWHCYKKRNDEKIIYRCDPINQASIPTAIWTTQIDTGCAAVGGWKTFFTSTSTVNFFKYQFLPPVGNPPSVYNYHVEDLILYGTPEISSSVNPLGNSKPLP